MMSALTLRRVAVICVLMLNAFLIPGLALAADMPAQPPIADAVLETDRSRQPDGKVTIAVHVSLSPKWLNPQEVPAVMAYEFLWKLHDNMIKAAPGNLYRACRKTPSRIEGLFLTLYPLSLSTLFRLPLDPISSFLTRPPGPYRASTC